MLTPEQIEMRKTGIGASESPMIMGESPHGGPIDLYLKKVGLAVEETTAAQKIGNYLEAGVAEYYAAEMGVRLTPATTLRHPELPWYLATPDRWVNGRQKLLQIKMVGQWMAHHWRDDDDGIPDYVRIQVTQEMDVAGVQLCDVCAVLGGTEPRIYQVEYDAELASYIREMVRSFWFDHILAREPPPVDGTESAHDLLKRLYPIHRAVMLDATDEAESLVSELRAAKVAVARGEHIESLVEQKLKLLIGDAEGMRGPDWAITWRTNKAGARPFLFNDQTKEKKRKKAA
jgi:putative phage-type endonuclease